jgi:dTDP-glucose 4,6-dehydratase
MRLLVTGGAGFLGVNLVRYVLRTQGAVRVTVLDALTYAGNPASLTELDADARFTFVEGDVRDVELVDRLMADIDAVVHLAAESHVDRSIDGPVEFLSTNVVGAGVVFDAARRHAVPRALHVSTDEVYGSIDAPGRFAEQSPLQPNSPYAASKAAADLLARSFGVTYGYPITVTRPTNVYGPYQLPEKVVPLFVTELLDGATVPLYGDGGNVREWTYVDDHVAGQWLALTQGTPGTVYNLGSGQELSNRELTDLMLATLGLGSDRIVHVPDRPGHDRRYALDSSRLRAVGWAPTTTIADGLAATIAWYQEHEDWWRPLKERGVSARRGTGAT